MSEPVRSDIGPVGIDRDDEIAGVCLERDRLSAALATAQQRIAELGQWQRDMVAKAAENSLDGYRELGARAAKAESERDTAQQQVRDLRAALNRFRDTECGENGCYFDIPTCRIGCYLPEATEAAMAATAEPEAER